MIANEHQYRVTKARAEAFARDIADLDTRGDDGEDPRLRGVLRAGMQEQLDELRAEMAEYNALRGGHVAVLDHIGLDRLGEALIQARIGAGLTQRELGDRLGVAEQQIQRYEQTRYSGASLHRLCDVATALGVHAYMRVLLPIETQPARTGAM